MSRYTSSGSYGHYCECDTNYYILRWYVDYHHGRIRYPRQFSRVTDKAGARRFCKRWGLEMPDLESAQEGR